MVDQNLKQRKKLLESKIRDKTGFKLSGSCDQVKAVLSELRSYDKKVERSSSFWLAIASLGVVAMLAAGMWGLWESTDVRINYTPMVLLGAVGLVWLVLFGALSTNTGINVEDRRYELAESVLNMLSRDISKDERIRLNLKLYPVTASHNLLKTIKARSKSGWNISLYADKWMQMQGVLLDGTKFSLAMTETRQARSRYKRSRSGKTKFKQKSKGASEVLLRLKVKSKKYPSIQDIEPDFKLAKGAQIKKSKISNDRIAITAIWQQPKRRGEATSTIPKHDLAGCASLLFLGAYRSLNTARA